ncbi:MAG: 50S ribosomal protein L23 [Chloroflexi bacterium]|nr:50S ribosomal protein L23 [Chloroflexota bacterium]
MHLYDVLRRPLITEKYTMQQVLGKYSFEVAEAATKPQIKQAVEKAFNVKVTAVNIMKVAGRRHRMARLGREKVAGPSWKKAVVTLKPGDKIEFFEAK